jgi:hypothetical protein
MTRRALPVKPGVIHRSGDERNLTRVARIALGICWNMSRRSALGRLAVMTCGTPAPRGWIMGELRVQPGHRARMAGITLGVGRDVERGFARSYFTVVAG